MASFLLISDLNQVLHSCLNVNSSFRSFCFTIWTKMASTKMYTKTSHQSNPSSNSSTYFHHQQAGPSSNTSHGMIDDEMTLTHEMHVKMAKKIAQLTKVSSSVNIFLLLKSESTNVFDKQFTCSVSCFEEKRKFSF